MYTYCCDFNTRPPIWYIPILFYFSTKSSNICQVDRFTPKCQQEACWPAKHTSHNWPLHTFQRVITYTNSCGIGMYLLEKTIVTLGGVIMDGSNIPHLRYCGPSHSIANHLQFLALTSHIQKIWTKTSQIQQKLRTLCILFLLNHDISHGFVISTIFAGRIEFSSNGKGVSSFWLFICFKSPETYSTQSTLQTHMQDQTRTAVYSRFYRPAFKMVLWGSKARFGPLLKIRPCLLHLQPLNIPNKLLASPGLNILHAIQQFEWMQPQLTYFGNYC